MSKEIKFKGLNPDNVFKVKGVEYSKIKRYVVRGVPHNAVRLKDNVCGFFKDSQVVEVEK